MSGHSKWAKIHRQKGTADAKRSNVFTKHSKNIALAAKNGGDPDMNFALRLAIDKAKAVNMPKDKIENAIKRGTGEVAGASYEEVMYEAYGPSGVPFLIEGVTDNKNRTTPEVKAILTKNGGSLGAQNSVAWMFEHKGVFRIDLKELPTGKDEFMLEVLNWGAEDVVEEDDGLTVYTVFTDFEKMKQKMETEKIQTEYAELDWVAKDKQEVANEVNEKINRLVDMLEDHDDVGSVYTNIK